MLKYIKDIIIPKLKEKNNLISDFLNNIINDSQKLPNKDDNKYYYESFKLLHNMLMILYNKCGYYDYQEKTFELNL